MNQGDTAFLLICAALALLMTPGLAFFYGGLVRANNAVSMMMLSFGALGVVGVLWVLYGYAIVFADSAAAGYIGVPGLVGLDVDKLGFGSVLADGTGAETAALLGPAVLQAMFAIITVALVSGAIADRAKLGPWLIFAAIWSTVVYFPVANWVFNVSYGVDGAMRGSWMTEGLEGLVGAGVLDFAGGTAVHINAGAAALALALVLGKRVGFAKGHQGPHSVPLVLFGTSLLWFGWFGFNAGSEGAADAYAALAVVNTLVAPAAAVLAWLLVETIRGGKATAVGAASGVVSGLVAITPACAYVTPLWAIVLGLLAGALCALAVDLKFRLGFDDSLDVVGIHLTGGLLGTIFLGFFANDVGLVYSGRPNQLIAQLIGAGAVLVYSFVVTAVIGFIVDRAFGFRLRHDDERAGFSRGGVESVLVTEKDPADLSARDLH